MMRALLSAACVCCLVGCSQSNEGVPDLDGDPAVFQDVQPILARDCGFIGCHGREGMPLMVYAVDFHRMRDPEGEIDETRPPLRENQLTEAELQHNRQALAARIDPDARAKTLDRFRRRLIPLDQGGLAHAGVVVYDDPNNSSLLAIMRFMETVR